MSDYSKKYYQENKESIKEKRRKYYQENKEVEYERTKKWRADNPEKAKELTTGGNMRRLEKEKAFSVSNPEEAKRRARNSTYRKRYGITLEEYETMEKDQGMTCAICKSKCKRYEFLSVDHCHKTGKVRGLLCHKCNSAIGYLGESVENLENAIKYLKV